jgi:hypothetical protein
MVSAWAHRLAVVAALVAAAPAWANQHSDDGKLFDMVCVEWSDAGVTAAAVSDSDGGLAAEDGGVEARCVKYETAYGCSSAGGGWLGALALIVLWRRSAYESSTRLCSTARTISSASSTVSDSGGIITTTFPSGRSNTPCLRTRWHTWKPTRSP